MHNLSTEPIGFRADGRPIFPIMGSSEPVVEPSTDPAPNTDPDPEPSTDDPDDGFDSLPEVTQNEIRRLRRADQRQRAELKRLKGTDGKAPAGKDQPSPADAIVAALKAAGIIPDDSTKPAASTAAAQDAVREAKVETAVYRVAGPLGANPDSVTDSLGFRRATADLDPGDPDFEKDVKAAVQDAIRLNPSLKSGATKAGPKTPKSGGDLSGGNGSTREAVPLTPHQRLVNAYTANSPT